MTDRETTAVTTTTTATTATTPIAATAATATTTSSTADPKNSDVRRTSPDLAHKTNTTSKNTLSPSPSTHVGHSNPTFSPGNKMERGESVCV